MTEKRGPKTNQRTIRNQQGQAMGAKGLQTRRRIVQATEELLKAKSLRELRVADIARAAKTSTSSFYLYFQDVSEAVLAVVGQVTQSTPDLLSQISEPWPEAEAHERARAFVEAYFENWQAHSTIFRVRNLAAEDGDQRFAALRMNALTPLLDALAARIEERQMHGGLVADLPAAAAASVMLSLLERIALARGPHLDNRGITRQQQLQVAAFFAAVLIGGAMAVGDLPRTWRS